MSLYTYGKSTQRDDKIQKEYREHTFPMEIRASPRQFPNEINVFELRGIAQCRPLNLLREVVQGRYSFRTFQVLR